MQVFVRRIKDLAGFLRRKKSTDSARVRLESRTRDNRLDKLTAQLRTLDKVLGLREVIWGQKGNYASVQLLSKKKSNVDLKIGIGVFLRKYPKIFELFVDQVNGKMCCRMSQEMIDLVNEEERVISEGSSSRERMKKLLMMSTTGSLGVHALWLARRELGFPEDFKKRVVTSSGEEFRVEGERVRLIFREREVEAEVEKWRERECRERWLGELEMKYAFPIEFPPGFKVERGCRERMREWQRLTYVKPYEGFRALGRERGEKRAVAILHEFLSLTVEKRARIDLFCHFRKDFCLEVNVREVLLKHPGIFYISTKGNSQTVYLREGFKRGVLMGPADPIARVRWKMLELVLAGRRGAAGSQEALTFEEREYEVGEVTESQRDGEWVVPILEKRCHVRKSQRLW